MNCSISTGPSAGALVRICTWTVVMSGTASIGRWATAYAPPSTRRTAPIRTSGRLARLQSTMRRSISVLVLQRCLGELRLEDEGALGDDDVPLLHPRQDLGEPFEGVPGLDEVTREDAGLGLHEDGAAPFEGLQGRLRHGEDAAGGLVLRARHLHLRLDEHAGPQPLVGV